MTTRYVNTASTAGGDGTTNATSGATRAYASLAEWEAAEQATLSEDHEVLCCGTTADAATTVDGWTPGSYRITIAGNTGDANGAHDGVYSASKYRLEGTHTGGAGGSLLILPEDNVTVKNLIAYHTTGTGNGIGREALQGSGIIVDSCVVRGTIASSTIGIVFPDASQTQLKIRNNIVYGFNIYGIYVRKYTAGHYIVNNTVVKCATGYRNRSGDSIALNNIAFGNTSSDWNNPATDWDGTLSAHNTFSNNGTRCPGSTDIDLSAYAGADIFLDYANDDYRLDPDGSAYSLLDDDGTGPSSEAEVPTLDINRDTRSGTTTSVGADIVVVSSGAITGTVSFSFSPTGILTGTGALVGTAAVSFTPVGVMTGTGNLVSTVANVLSITGTLTNGASGEVFGTVSFAFTPTGTLTGTGALVGSSAIALDSIGTLTGMGALATTIAVACAVNGTLSTLASGDMASNISLAIGITAALAGNGALSGDVVISLASENLLLYSEEFNTAGISQAIRAIVTNNATTAPDGTTTAEKLSDTTDINQYHGVQNYGSSWNYLSGESFTYSVFAKAAELSVIALRIAGNDSNFASGHAVYFDLAAGRVSQEVVGLTARMYTLANDWYRLSVSGTATGSGTGTPMLFLSNSPTGDLSYPAYTGDGSGLYIWGEMINAGLVPAGYKRTTAAKTLTGTLTGTGTLTSAIPFALSPVGNMTGTGALASTIANVFADIAALTGVGNLTTNISNIIDVTGLFDADSIASLLALELGVVGNLSGFGALQSNVEFTFDASGALASISMANWTASGETTLVWTKENVVAAAWVEEGALTRNWDYED